MYIMSTSGSSTSSLYVPYPLAVEGALIFLRNASALVLEDEEAAAATVCLISVTSRVFGSTRRSLVLKVKVN